MTDPVSGAAGTQTVTDPTPRPAPGTPTVIPEGAVVLTREEHNRNQAELRRAQKTLRERDEADAAATQQREVAAAEERGEFDRVVQLEREEKERLQRQLRETRATDALRDEISRRGYAGTPADALRALTQAGDVTFNDDGTPSYGSVSGAVDAVLNRYGDLVKDKPADPKPPRTAGPATPPPADQLPEGYISPEEYASTPADIRRTPEFQARVARSKGRWPVTQHRSVFEPAGG